MLQVAKWRGEDCHPGLALGKGQPLQLLRMSGESYNMMMMAETLALLLELRATMGQRDPYHISLGPDMVEALICIKDWVAAERKGNI
jgi:hypothetical protein